ncbi:MAG TPA: Gfo/Idh/MocA family oxidoreductase, partial [Candidatus Methylomirabilis sp.]|nr:Gfo/Idh/MocA family oxidoreductase [Candidatus Methylomirabilis sp.]
GSRYATHLLAGDVPGASLAAVCRRNVEAARTFAASHGITAHAEPDLLFADPEVDAVLLVVPPNLHPTLVPAALAAGKPILVEKPLATDTEGCRTILAAARGGSVPLMVAHTLRFDTVVQALQARLPQIAPLTFLALDQLSEPSSQAWGDAPGVGGALVNTGVHGFDLVRVLTGREVLEVICRTARARSRHTEDTFAAILTLSGPPDLAVVTNSRAAGGRSGRIVAVGQAGQLAGDVAAGTLTLVRGRDQTPIPLPPSAPTVREVLRAFARTLQGGTPVPVSAEEGARAVAVAEACARSAAEGRPIRPAG